MHTRPRLKHLLLLATLMSLAVAGSGCGTDDTPDPAGSEPSGSGPVESGTAAPDGSGPDQEPALRLLTPLDGDVVDVPFVLYVETVHELGTGDGGHQLYVWFNDEDADPLVLTSANASIDDEQIDIPEGDATLNVQLFTADQEPVGEVASAEITIYDDQEAES